MQDGQEIDINLDSIQSFNIRSESEEILTEKEKTIEEELFGIGIHIDELKEYKNTYFLEIPLEDGNWYSVKDFDEYYDALNFARENFTNAKHFLDDYSKDILNILEKVDASNLTLRIIEKLATENDSDMDSIILTIISLEEFGYIEKTNAIEIYDELNNETAEIFKNLGPPKFN